MQATVTDSFDMKGRVALEYGATGVVICIAADSDAEQPRQGMNLLLVRPDGWMIRVRTGEVKSSGESRLHSVFLENLTREDAPVGTRVRWGADFWPNASEELNEPTHLLRA